MSDVLNAVSFAIWAHSVKVKDKEAKFQYGGQNFQMRKDVHTGLWVHYSIHPVVVANLLESAGQNTTVQCAGVCHDILEDTTVKLDELQQIIGEHALRLVMWVTDHEFKGSRSLRSMLKAERLARAPREARAVKLADMVSNTFDSQLDKAKFWDDTKRDEVLMLLECLADTDKYLEDLVQKAIVSTDAKLCNEERFRKLYPGIDQKKVKFKLP